MSTPLAAQRLYSQETEDLRLLYYSPNHAYLVPHLMACFENAMDFHQELFSYTPTEKVTVLLNDFGDFGHGGADTIPTNHMSIGLEPFNYVYETMPANERMNWLMNHELMHIVVCDKGNRDDQFFRKLFNGKVVASAEDPLSIGYSFLTNPRRYSPRWYHEGIAVFMETWMAGGLGRTLGGYDEMVFRSLVRDDSHIYDVVGLESEGTAIDFQVGVNSYLYGTRFMTHLAYQYGPERLLEWINRIDGTRRYFSAQFRETFGVSLETEWNRWIEFERGWQKANLELIRTHPVTPLQPATREALGSVSRPYYEASTGKLYAGVRYPGQMAHLAAIDLESGKLEHLTDINGAALFYVTSLSFDPSSRTLFYTTDNNYWRDLNAFDLNTGKSRLLIKNLRVGDLAFNPADNSLWGIRHNDGLSTLVRVTPPYRFWAGVYTFPYGEDIFDIDISPDGRLMTAAVVDLSGKQRLVKMTIEKLMRGDAGFEVIYDFEYSSPANFVFSPDGRYVYGTSYYTGASNVFRFDVESHEMAVLSNSETGLFRPLLLPGGRLMAMEYTAQGFVPVQFEEAPIEDVSAVRYLGQEIVEKYPIVKTWKLGSPRDIDVQSRLTYSGDYSPMKHTSFMAAYPIVQGYIDQTAVGMRFDFSDHLGLSALDVNASVTPGGETTGSEKVHLGFNYRYWNWKVSGGFNEADFYDLFGPTKTSRKGYFLRLDQRKNLIFEKPRSLDFDWGLAGYGGLEKLPEYQNVDASVENFFTANASLSFSYLDKALGGVDDEKGVKWQLSTRTNLVRSELLPRVYGNFDYGLLTPINNSPVWFRASAGKSFGDRDNPFANFYFGGFGNNWVDHQEISRYREYYAFPGVELNQIGGTDFAKGTVEWNLPPVKFRNLGAPYLYCNWARFSLFTSGLGTHLTSPVHRQLWGNLGAQLDFRVVLFSYLNSTFSLGYAVAADKDRNTSGEFMISLKLL